MRSSREDADMYEAEAEARRPGLIYPSRYALISDRRHSVE